MPRDAVIEYPCRCIGERIASPDKYVFSNVRLTLTAKSSMSHFWLLWMNLRRFVPEGMG
jgi:hypothetical protein